jgi:tetratricopeptide (TPR) repeat protein
MRGHIRIRATMKRRVATVILAAFAVTIAGCAGFSRRAPRRVSAPKGIGQYVAAVRAQSAGDEERAIAALEKATAANPELTMAQGMLGDLYRSRGEYDKAVPHYEAMTRLDPYTPENHYELGLVYQLLRRLEDAAASYLRGLQLDPKDADAHMNLGMVYLALGRADDAVRHAEQATQLDPESPEPFTNLGVALEASGEYAKAEAAYRRSLDLDPQQQQTLLNLGLNLIHQNKGADAVSIMQRVLQTTDTPFTRKVYGDALSRAGRFDDAVEQYRIALERQPGYYQALNEIGWTRIAEYRKGLQLDETKRKSAIEHWEKSLKINANQPRIETAIANWGENTLFGN